MNIPAITNTQQQNFKGNINIVNDLSYLPCKYVRQAYDSMAEMIKDKPFDLFIRQNHKEKSLSFIAKKVEHLGKIHKPFVETVLLDASTLDKGASTKDIYTAMAKKSIDDYEVLSEALPKGLIKRFLNFNKTTKYNHVN